ncbi:6-phosphofructokinase [Paenibacillus hunanensis]|uniref:6-phosphofructokinase n=1 Tax=Paenibacillus hunanensis TaxID=539262 RepID=UPI002A6A0BF4|nr:6-phosphofructokinase [Paenibacillus hunanensis]WPP40038.1 6-phosphofructokinase [Paenibacillus hunanensis]
MSATESAVQKIAVLTSGGDSQGMNAAVRAVVRSALYYGIEVCGIQRGYQGLLNEDIFPMDLRSVGDIIQRGGTVLQSARCKEFMTLEGQQKGADILRKHGIDGLVVIGGDGSYQGANKLSKLGIKTMGLPGTIDNDISFTDYTIGFDTSVGVVVDAINKLRDTMSSHERVSIVEVMGRHCGDIALHAGLASGAESILVPEVPFDLKEIADRMHNNFACGKRHSIIIVAEGAGRGEDVAEQLHLQYPNLEPRVTVLGHIQRGGTPTPRDRNLASRLGDYAVRMLIAGESDKACGIIKGELSMTDIDQVVNTKKDFDHATYELALRLSQ